MKVILGQILTNFNQEQKVPAPFKHDNNQGQKVLGLFKNDNEGYFGSNLDKF